MKAKTIKSSSYVQSLIDKYIYYVLINESHKKQVAKNLGYGNINDRKLNLV